MKLELQDRFYLEVLLCMATSDVKFTEYNELTMGARRLISFEFPRDLNPSLEDICFFIEGFYSSNGKAGRKAAMTFVKSFARKDPKKFQALAADQAKPLHFRKYRLRKGVDSIILSTAALYGIDTTEQFDI